MSCLVTRPPVPEPWIWLTSTLCSLRDAAHERRRCAGAVPLPAAPTCPPERQRVGTCALLQRCRGARIAPVPASTPTPLPVRQPWRIAGASGGGRDGEQAPLGRRSTSPAGPIVRDDAVDRNRLALGDRDLGEHAGRRRRNLRIDLVGRDLEQRLVAIDRLADLLHPADDRAFGDRLAHLGHQRRVWAYAFCQAPPRAGSAAKLLTCESPRRARRATPRRPPPRTSDARGSS